MARFECLCCLNHRMATCLKCKEKDTKKAILVSYDKDSIFQVDVVEIPCDFEHGIDDQYGDKIPFSIGSNQSLKEYNETYLRALEKMRDDEVREFRKREAKGFS